MKGSGSTSDYERKVPHKKYTGPASGTEDCDIQFITKIAKPNTAILKVKNGDVLLIRLGTKNVLEALNDDREICGYINSPDNAKIVSCIGRGVQYRAVVLSRTALVCNVRVEILK